MKALFNWSSGKDSALALYKILQDKSYEINYLLTSVSSNYDRVSMHGVRTSLLEKQAEKIGIPLIKMMVPEMPTMEAYEQTMNDTLQKLKAEGITASFFGDIFLEDLRKYREEKLNQIDMQAVFPLWKISTDLLIREFIDLGFKTIVTCVNEKFLDKSFCGRIIDEQFLKDLPSDVDPCGENGEFHTFAFEGPVFKSPVKFTTGEIVYRKYTNANSNNDVCKTDDPFNTGFWYCDLLPLEQ